MEEFYTYTLPNGIRGIHRQVRSNVAHCALAINAGSRDELPSQYGLAHFTEHALFKGTHRRKAYQVNCRLENLGGELNAYTTKEDTTVHATTLRSDFAKAVELLSDVVFESTFPDRELDREREVITDEINTYKDSPSDMLYDTFEDMLFAGSSLGHNILGTKNSISKFDSAAVRAFTSRTHTADQMVFASIGNFSPRTAQAVAERYLACRAATVRGYSRTTPRSTERFEKCVVKHTHQHHCIVGNRAYGIYHPRRLQLALLVNILGGPSANSLLNVNIREKHGLSYNIEATYAPYCDSGMIAVYFSTDNSDACLSLVDEQIRLLQTHPLTSRRLSMAKKQYMAQAAVAAESNESYMLGAGKSMLIHDNVLSLAEVCRRIAAVTAEDLMEVANEVLSDNSILIYK